MIQAFRQCCRGTLLFVLITGAPLVHSDQISIAVASNFLSAAKSLAKNFEASNAHRVTISSASSGKLYAQIINGAPYHIFLSADAATPARLEQEGLGVPGTRFTYVVGSLVLWSADPSLLNSTNGAQVLAAGNYKRLAIANPKIAPYGQATMSVIKNLELQKSIRSKLIKGENVAQAFQYLVTQVAELGFVALSQIKSPASAIMGSHWRVPTDLYPPIHQQAILLSRAHDLSGARAFLKYLQSDQAKRLLAHDYGYRME